MENMISILGTVVDSINSILWGYVLVFGLVGIGVYYSFALGFPQFFRIGPAIKQSFGLLYKDDPTRKRDNRSISPFQALAIAISAQIGTGNVAGVATAIMAGGPGAVFWMWVSALFGMGTIFSEAVLAQKYRKEVAGVFIGGPAFYISRGLKNILGEKTAKFLSYFFAFALIVSVGFTGSMIQSNAIATTIANAFDVQAIIVGIVIAVLAAAIFIGGIQRIAYFAKTVVPIMAGVYILSAFTILYLFSDQIVPMFQHIFIGAFNPQALGGGFLGITMKEAIRFGVARGLFSNEAGMGSTPHAHATALVAHPVLQGLTAFVGVFVDTMLVCTATALIILLTGADQLGLSGALVTQEAFNVAFGHWGPKLIAVCLTFFAFTTIIGWYYFGESNVRYLTTKSWAVHLFRVYILTTIIVGTLGQSDLVWNMADMFNGLMVIPNVIALFFLRHEVKDALRDYDEKRQHGVPIYDYKH